ncbi:Protein transport protein use1 [Phlyctema vagabunda]|uniref:Protein transport protein use1 n=1 Tax=Phlyctema vagabunda TaxID=108571 RepID=A0ABR4PZ69_9HELO
MARLPMATGVEPTSDPTGINLTRLIARLREKLITPDEVTESLLRRSRSEREQVAEIVTYARSLLTRLEQDAQEIKVQTRKQEVQADLIKKRQLVERFGERIEELNEAGQFPEADVDSSDGEDLLGEDTPPETDDQASSTHDYDTGDPILQSPNPELIAAAIAASPSAEEASGLRARFPGSQTAAADTGISTATAEALLTHNRTEQEALTSSLLSMAAQLKAQSHAFAASLEDEKGILDATNETLDKNESGMEAAQKRMGYLRTMTEGKGWWGRMLMYAWIAGLMVIAILIVFVLPKLRF